MKVYGLREVILEIAGSTDRTITVAELMERLHKLCFHEGKVICKGWTKKYDILWCEEAWELLLQLASMGKLVIHLHGGHPERWYVEVLKG